MKVNQSVGNRLELGATLRAVNGFVGVGTSGVGFDESVSGDELDWSGDSRSGANRHATDDGRKLTRWGVGRER
jgi:hypothetical protein